MKNSDRVLFSMLAVILLSGAGCLGSESDNEGGTSLNEFTCEIESTRICVEYSSVLSANSLEYSCSALGGTDGAGASCISLGCNLASCAIEASGTTSTSYYGAGYMSLGSSSTCTTLKATIATSCTGGTFQDIGGALAAFSCGSI
jgi:hypothetical protein